MKTSWEYGKHITPKDNLTKGTHRKIWRYELFSKNDKYIAVHGLVHDSILRMTAVASHWKEATSVIGNVLLTLIVLNWAQSVFD